MACSEFTPGRGPFGMQGIYPGSGVCRTNVLSTVLSLRLPFFFLSGKIGKREDNDFLY